MHDHRKPGRELVLFDTDPLMGVGLPYARETCTRSPGTGATDDQVALRLRDGRRLDALPAAEVLTRIAALVDARSTELWEQVPAGR